MTNNTILLLEDDIEIQKGFSNIINDMGLGMSLDVCKTIDEYETKRLNENFSRNVKILIFDLATKTEELKTKKYKALEFIEENYNKNRVPIFIHSGFLNELDDYENEGTIFKIEKSTNSIEEICKKIKLFNDTGFLEIFPSNGVLEQSLISELHNAFVSQFKNDEIEKILRSIKGFGEKDDKNDNRIKERTLEVFKRIALRTVYREISSEAINNQTGEINDVEINAIEHYYRRNTRFDYWTGDIFKKKSDEEINIVLSPRCNIDNGNIILLLCCKINGFTEKDIRELKAKNGTDKYRRKIIDNVQSTGERYRFLPRTPQFEGGNIDFNAYFTISPSELESDYELIITLSDELTNEILRKFSTFISRMGITNTDIFESIYYIDR